MALAHRLITVLYNVLMRRVEYVERGGDFYERKNNAAVVALLRSGMEI